MKRYGFSLVKLAIGIFAIASLLFLCSSLWRSQASHRQALAGWEECQQVANEISKFRSGPRIASIEIEPPERIALRVIEAAEQAAVAPNSILSIAPQSLVRVGRSPYQSRATQIVLQNVTLTQSAHFIESLEDQANGSIVRDMVVARSRVLGDDGGELWNVRLTLTQLVFSPISTR